MKEKGSARPTTSCKLQRRIDSLHKSPTLRAVQKSSWLSFLWVFSRDNKVGLKFRVFHYGPRV